jgi:hypothetical protein
MACEKCEREGKTKIIHFQRGGRWDTRVFCAHTYTQGKLNKAETNHVISRHQVAPIKSASRPKSADRRIKHTYSAEEDRFIIANYVTAEFGNHRGEGQMKKMRLAFEERFGWRPSANQMVGRYTRLNRDRPEIVEQVRGVPSLPVLKFMQGDGMGSKDA